MLICVYGCVICICRRSDGRTDRGRHMGRLRDSACYVFCDRYRCCTWLVSCHIMSCLAMCMHSQARKEYFRWAERSGTEQAGTMTYSHGENMRHAHVTWDMDVLLILIHICVVAMMSYMQASMWRRALMRVLVPMLMLHCTEPTPLLGPLSLSEMGYRPVAQQTFADGKHPHHSHTHHT